MDHHRSTAFSSQSYQPQHQHQPHHHLNHNYHHSPSIPSSLRPFQSDSHSSSPSSSPSTSPSPYPSPLLSRDPNQKLSASSSSSPRVAALKLAAAGAHHQHQHVKSSSVPNAPKPPSQHPQQQHHSSFPASGTAPSSSSPRLSSLSPIETDFDPPSLVGREVEKTPGPNGGRKLGNTSGLPAYVPKFHPQHQRPLHPHPHRHSYQRQTSQDQPLINMTGWKGLPLSNSGNHHYSPSQDDDENNDEIPEVDIDLQNDLDPNQHQDYELDIDGAAAAGEGEEVDVDVDFDELEVPRLMSLGGVRADASWASISALNPNSNGNGGSNSIPSSSAGAISSSGVTAKGKLVGGGNGGGGGALGKGMKLMGSKSASSISQHQQQAAAGPSSATGAGKRGSGGSISVASSSHSNPSKQLPSRQQQGGKHGGASGGGGVMGSISSMRSFSRTRKHSIPLSGSSAGSLNGDEEDGRDRETDENEAPGSEFSSSDEDDDRAGGGGGRGSRLGRSFGIGGGGGGGREGKEPGAGGGGMGSFKKSIFRKLGSFRRTKSESSSQNGGSPNSSSPVGVGAGGVLDSGGEKRPSKGSPLLNVTDGRDSPTGGKNASITARNLGVGSGVGDGKSSRHDRDSPRNRPRSVMDVFPSLGGSSHSSPVDEYPNHNNNGNNFKSRGGGKSLDLQRSVGLNSSTHSSSNTRSTTTHHTANNTRFHSDQEEEDATDLTIPSGGGCTTGNSGGGGMRKSATGTAGSGNGLGISGVTGLEGEGKRSSAGSGVGNTGSSKESAPSRPPLVRLGSNANIGQNAKEGSLSKSGPASSSTSTSGALKSTASAVKPSHSATTHHPLTHHSSSLTGGSGSSVSAGTKRVLPKARRITPEERERQRRELEEEQRRERERERVRLMRVSENTEGEEEEREGGKKEGESERNEEKSEEELVETDLDDHPRPANLSRSTSSKPQLSQSQPHLGSSRTKPSSSSSSSALASKAAAGSFPTPDSMSTTSGPESGGSGGALRPSLLKTKAKTISPELGFQHPASSSLNNGSASSNASARERERLSNTTNASPVENTDLDRDGPSLGVGYASKAVGSKGGLVRKVLPSSSASASLVDRPVSFQVGGEASSSKQSPSLSTTLAPPSRKEKSSHDATGSSATATAMAPSSSSSSADASASLTRPPKRKLPAPRRLGHTSGSGGGTHLEEPPVVDEEGMVPASPNVYHTAEQDMRHRPISMVATSSAAARGEDGHHAGDSSGEHGRGSGSDSSKQRRRRTSSEIRRDMAAEEAVSKGSRGEKEREAARTVAKPPPNSESRLSSSNPADREAYYAQLPSMSESRAGNYGSRSSTSTAAASGSMSRPPSRLAAGISSGDPIAEVKQEGITPPSSGEKYSRTLRPVDEREREQRERGGSRLRQVNSDLREVKRTSRQPQVLPPEEERNEYHDQHPSPQEQQYHQQPYSQPPPSHPVQTSGSFGATVEGRPIAPLPQRGHSQNYSPEMPPPPVPHSASAAPMQPYYDPSGPPPPQGSYYPAPSQPHHPMPFPAQHRQMPYPDPYHQHQHQQAYAPPQPPPQQQLPPANKEEKRKNLASVSVNNRNYFRVGLLGKGGSSRVYRVLDGIGSNPKMYALKKVELARGDRESYQSFCNEINLLEKLKGNERVIKLVDSEVNREKSTLYLVMELGETDLNGLLWGQIGKPLSMNFIRHIWEQMLECVQVVHDANIVHTDLKPANFVMVKGSLKLIDFGISKAIPNDTTNIGRDQQIGTANYMSPEALADSGKGIGGKRLMKLGRPSDVWSLGCILYQMVYGHTPFSHIKNVAQKIIAIQNQNAEIFFPEYAIPKDDKGNLMEDLKFTLEQDLVDTMKSCLTFEPKQRATITKLLAAPFLKSSGNTESAKPDWPPMRAEFISQIVSRTCKLSNQRPGGLSSMDQERLVESLVRELNRSRS